MKFQRSLFILLLGLIGVASYFAFRPIPPLLAPDRSPPPASTLPVQPIVPSAVPYAADAKTKKIVAIESSPDEARPENVVPFVVQDGVALAFGDVILGATEDEGLKSGLSQVPVPSLWEKPEIPYAIDPDVVEPERVLEAIRHIEKKTGVRFVPFGDQPDAILFQKGPKDCWSTLGRQGGLQPIRLAPRCGWKEITHEILHSFGFLHEQSRFDRDTYVEILWDNIEKDFRPQFDRLPRELLGVMDAKPFDYQSIMLYDTRMFARDAAAPTMKSRTEVAITPSATGLSEWDVHKVKTLFRLD